MITVVSSAVEAPLPDDRRRGAEGGSEGPAVALRVEPARSELTRVLDSLLSIGEAASIVEVGCGVGELATWFARQAPRGRIVGVDSSIAMLRRATARAEQVEARNTSFVFGSVNHIPLDDGSADLVVCKHLLCVLYDVDRAMEEMIRIAKPGGLVAAIEPASPHLFHDPDDAEFTSLSQRLNQAFFQGWRRRGVDQRIGLKVPGLFLRHGLEDVRASAVSQVHLLADPLRSPDEVKEQLETESYRIPESTVNLVLDGGMSRRDLEDHGRRTRERLRRFLDDPLTVSRSGYTRLAPSVIVTVGRKSRPA